jgi:A/G-specific adenine glycosylase
MHLQPKNVHLFQEKIRNYYYNHKRDFPWRESHNPYHILVSEVMLQQTQTSRVENKYTEFLLKYPTIETLAESSFSDILRIWQGLGYNRRAKNLHQSARIITHELRGLVPQTYETLVLLPGIGQNTAGAILAYAFNIAQPFIETNIRSVYLHEFLIDREQVSDKEILELVKDTMDTNNPREWFYALTDYGVYLKQTIGNQNLRSTHYTKQSEFEGSRRQIRAQILKLLLTSRLSANQLLNSFKTTHSITSVLFDMEKERLIEKIGDIYRICE